MAETEQVVKTYRGNCQCGAYMFELKVPEIKVGSECNCSICSKKGYCWNSVPAAEDAFTVVKGDEKDLKGYTFGLMSRHKSAPPGKNHVINIRALQRPFDLLSIETKPFDGLALPPPYETPVYDGPEPEASVENGEIQHGSCHCGAVKLALNFKPVMALDVSKDEERIVECNCGICQRCGYMWIYPKRDQMAFEGADNLTHDSSGRGIWAKSFCKTCGVHFANELNDLTAEEVAALPEDLRTWRAGILDARPINVRVLNGLDVAALTTKKVDEYNMAKQPDENP